ncbi:MAG: glycosyltransferase family 39 protein [Anaerolineae bacterium]|nr:glycosyltransferase family 39 protein [Anaerolineae bacterium]
MKRMRGLLLAWSGDVAALTLSCAIFMALTFHQIDLPGLHTDEALEVLPAMQLVRGQEVECYKDVCIEVLGLRLPVMIYEYIASVNTYMAIPFFALFGVSVPTLRTMAILQSVAAMVFLYALARELYNRRVAVLAVLLISVGPSFVFWSRQGVFVTSVTIPISLAGAWAWLRWWRSSRSRYLYLGAFLFGLGVSAKFLFGWLLAGVGAAFVLLNLDRVAAACRARSLAPLGIQVRRRDLGIAVVLFVIGLLPLIVFNVRTLSTVHYIRDNLLGVSYYEVDNARIGENLRERIKELRSVLNGETFWYLSINPYASWRWPSAFLSAAGIAAFALYGRAGGERRDALPVRGTVALTVVGGYAVLFALPLHEGRWAFAILGIGAAAGVCVGLIARLRRMRLLAMLGTGLGAACLTIAFVYLAWKMARWEPHWKVYVGGVLALAAAPWLRARADTRRVLFPVLVIAGMIVLSVFSPTALWFTHLAIVTPWPPLVVAAVVDLIARRTGADRLHLGRIGPFRRFGWATGISVGLLVALLPVGVLVYDDLEVDLAYHRELSQIGGKGDHTHASYRLVEALRAEGATRVVAMDFGIQDVVQFLTAGEVNPIEVFGYADRGNPDPGFGVRVREQLAHAEARYVFRVQPLFQNRWELFGTIVAQEGKQIVDETLVYDWSAIPIYRIVRVSP